MTKLKRKAEKDFKNESETREDFGQAPIFPVKELEWNSKIGSTSVLH